ncbi:MAG: ligand-gated channel protein [Nitrospinaceae bacterium]|nr:MAG: ligand-gated channel protein [Nitrospinaceae bacterium]
MSEEQLEILSRDIRELMQTDVIVTTVSKRPQLLHETASAIYVITQEDIRRTGAVNIMEALRIVPGVQVSKINQNRYAISIRGFNRRLGSDKLLVMIDGRTVYSPSASGVFWIGQDTVLEDVDRIEVIRGPGASLWGANAVAGVINIITRSSLETQDGFISGGSGTEENGFATLRYGGKVGKDFSYRIYGKYRDRDEGKKTDGTQAIDDKQMGQGGFRSDWQINPRDNFTLQGDYYNLDAGLDFSSRFVSLTAGSLPFQGSNIHKGTNILSRWTRKMKDSSSFQFQAYFDRLERRSNLPNANTEDQVDLDFQHNFLIGKRHNFIWGLSYRYSYFDFKQTNILTLPNQGTNLFGVFFHDEFTMVPDRWNLILGTKLEYNEFTGIEVQPNIRTAWTPDPKNTFWAAVSRAVRTPSITEERAVANRALVPAAPPTLPLPLLIKENNDERTNAEELIAYEAGYRFKPKPELNFDITGYYFDYNGIIESVNTGATTFNAAPIPHLQLTAFNDNVLEGEVFGVELSAQWQPLENWRLSGSYTFTKIDLRPSESGLAFPQAPTGEGDLDAEGEPEHIYNLRSYLNLPYDLEFDTLFYYVSKNSVRKIPGYSRVDLRLGWRPTKSFELSLVGQNILDDSHLELTELLEKPTETERSFYVKATYNFALNSK